MIRPLTTFLILCSLTTLPLALAACSDDSSQDPAGQGGNTIVVNVEPDALAAAWNLDGPGDALHAGSGDQTLAGLAPGAYTIRWGEVDGWISPSSETQTLTAGGRVTFRASYVQEGSGTPIVVDHRAVLDFDAGRIPQRWIDEVKSRGILIHLPGRSHAQQLVGDLDGDPVKHIGGLETLENSDPRYAVAIACDLADLPADGALRILKGQYDPADGELIETWECRFDDLRYWATASGRATTEFTVAHADDLGHPIDASIFGWSYHLIAPGKVHDEDGGETTFDDERRDAYLAAMASFREHSPGAVFVYATAPTDDGYANSAGYLEDDGLRATVYNDAFRQAALTSGAWLFDQADIENWNADFTRRRHESYDGHDLELRHTDWDGTDCAHGGMGICVAKAKALWWLAARLAGWDGTPATP